MASGKSHLPGSLDVPRTVGGGHPLPVRPSDPDARQRWPLSKDMEQYSPKSSPRQVPVPVGSHSPNVTSQQVDSTGLKMTISLKQKTPFYLMRSEQIQDNETTGATNLMAARGLEHSYQKLTSIVVMIKSASQACTNTVNCSCFHSSQEDEGFPVLLPPPHAWHRGLARKPGQQLFTRNH